jgi:NTP pyrophosphatase (non-canonical NTP hydrolase)
VTLDEYQQHAARTAPREFKAYPQAVRLAVGALGEVYAEETGRDLLQLHDQLIWSLGLAGESGEFVDLMKKHFGHGKPLDRDQVKKELGDVLWYVANLARSFGYTLSNVAQGNIDKLKVRYPDGFTVEASQAKADEALVFENGSFVLPCEAASDYTRIAVERVSSEPAKSLTVGPVDANGSPVDGDR